MSWSLGVGCRIARMRIRRWSGAGHGRAHQGWKCLSLGRGQGRIGSQQTGARDQENSCRCGGRMQQLRISRRPPSFNCPVKIQFGSSFAPDRSWHCSGAPRSMARRFLLGKLLALPHPPLEGGIATTCTGTPASPAPIILSFFSIWVC